MPASSHSTIVCSSSRPTRVYPRHLVLNTCSAEDLVVLKAFADRPQDWLDIEGIIVCHGRALDRAHVLDELISLLEMKEDLSPRATLEKLLRKHP
jgi:hypothetical protein